MKQGWEIKKLGEVLLIERGGSPRPIQKYMTDSPDGINWIKISDATASDKYIYETKEKITRDGLHKTRVVNNGDFILSNSMSFGRPYIMKTTGCIHDGWLVLKQDGVKTFDTDFLYYLLSSPYVFQQFNSLASGSTVRNLNISLVSSVKVPVPSIKEQEYLVSILEDIFTEISKAKDNAEQNLKNSKELFESYLESVFTNKSENWEEKTLEEVCEIDPKKSEIKGLDANHLVSFLPMKDLGVFQNKIISKDTRKLSEVMGSYTYFRNNDVLLAKVTPCFENGKLGIAKNLVNGIGFGSSEYIVFRSLGDIVAEYIFYSLSSAKFRNDGKKLMFGACGLKRLSKDYVKTFTIPFPPLKTQQVIVQKLETLSIETKRLEAIYKQKLKDLEELKKSILQRAFNGEL